MVCADRLLQAGMLDADDTLKRHMRNVSILDVTKITLAAASRCH